MSNILDVFATLWLWVRVDIIGHDLIAYGCVLIYFFMILGSIGLPLPIILAFLIPSTIALIILVALGWFGWLIIILGGLSFGMITYRLIVEG